MPSAGRIGYEMLHLRNRQQRAENSRLVAEARLAHARVQGKVVVYSLRDRHAKFSAHEDLSVLRGRSEDSPEKDPSGRLGCSLNGLRRIMPNQVIIRARTLFWGRV